MTGIFALVPSHLTYRQGSEGVEFTLASEGYERMFEELVRPRTQGLGAQGGERCGSRKHSNSHERWCE